MHQDSSTTTVTRTTIPLRVSQWHFPRTCTHCGETIPAGVPTCHYFKDGQLMIVCRRCAAGPEFSSPFPRASNEPACPTCGQPLENGNCFNIACPDGLANVQDEVGKEDPSMAQKHPAANADKIIPFLGKQDRLPEGDLREVAELALDLFQDVAARAIREHEARYHGHGSSIIPFPGK